MPRKAVVTTGGDGTLRKNIRKHEANVHVAYEDLCHENGNSQHIIYKGSWWCQ